MQKQTNESENENGLITQAKWQKKLREKQSYVISSDPEEYVKTAT